MSIPDEIRRELHEKALRHCIWIAILEADLLNYHEVSGQLTAVLVHVDAIQERDEHDDIGEQRDPPLDAEIVSPPECER